MFRVIAGAFRMIGFALVVLFGIAVHWPLETAAVLAVFLPIAFYRFQREEKRRRSALMTTDVRLLSPIEYEQFCAKTLRAAGWSVKTTPLQDQGVDVIAELRGVRAVIQCKKYRSRVGNAAVQQVVAGKRHYRAVVAAVVAPAGYTRAAEALARSNGVILLHHEDLAKLERLARIP